MEILNAKIESADIDIERFLNIWIELNLQDGYSQNFGGYYLAGEFGCTLIRRILETVGVEKWSQLKGKPVRIKREDELIRALGHYLKDVWVNPSKLVEELALEKDRS